MITRQDLQQLQSFICNPALSILLPTHRTSPDNKQDPILVKNRVDEATSRLSEESSTRELEPLLERLKALVNPGGVNIMDDAVDEIIEAVLAKGGDVIMVDDEALAAHQSIALILRY